MQQTQMGLSFWIYEIRIAYISSKCLNSDKLSRTRTACRDVFIYSLDLNWYVARSRLENFVVGLTNDDPATTPPVYKTSYTICAQFDGSVDPSQNATVTCAPSSEKFRYLIVQGTKDALCLLEVYVYGRE